MHPVTCSGPAGGGACGCGDGHFFVAANCRGAGRQFHILPVGHIFILPSLGQVFKHRDIVAVSCCRALLSKSNFDLVPLSGPTAVSMQKRQAVGQVLVNSIRKLLAGYVNCIAAPCSLHPVAPDSLEGDWARVAQNSALVGRVRSAAVFSHFGVGVAGVDSQNPGSVVACREW